MALEVAPRPIGVFAPLTRFSFDVPANHRLEECCFGHALESRMEFATRTNFSGVMMIPFQERSIGGVTGEEGLVRSRDHRMSITAACAMPLPLA